MTEIHQVAVGAGRGDAITSMMLEVRDELRTVVKSDIFAFHVDPSLADVRHLHAFPRRSGDQRLIIYHASMGEPAVTRFLLRRREPILLMYHNITPSEFFLESTVEVAMLAEWGRWELHLIADRCVGAAATSAFSARDLEQYGYANVAVVPVGVNPDRLLGYDVDTGFARRLRRDAGETYALCVSQLFPHKRHELAIEAVHLLQEVHGMDVGLVVVGAPRVLSYRDALDALVDELGVRGVVMTGPITDRQLATAYSGASVYVTASEHEGLALPPLEAMAYGVPVVARKYGALADTVGSAGMLLGPDAGPRHLAEAVAEVLTNDSLSAALKARGVHRIRGWQPDHTMASFLDLVADAL